MSSLTSFLFPHHHQHHYHFQFHNLSVSHKNNKCRFLYLLQSPRARAIRSPKLAEAEAEAEAEDDDAILETKTRKRGVRRKQRQSDYDYDDDDDDDDDDGSSFIDQLVDNLFILQVFKSYGWFLPIILVSFLLANGAKAFLMSSGILFGVSIVIFAFQKLWDWVEGSPKPQKRRKKRSKSGRRKGIFVEENDVEEESFSGTRGKKRDSQSWVSRNNGFLYDKDSSSEVGFNNFGGWDELVREDEAKTPRKRFQETERLERMMEKERLSRSMEERDLPLLLKIMIAVFPFLASWTNNMM